MAKLREFSLFDLDTKPVALGFHKQAIEAQIRATEKLRVPFPAFNVLDEATSYETHKAQAEKVIEAAADLILEQIEILRDMADLKTDRANFRELLNELVGEELYEPNEAMEREAAE